MSLPNNYVQVYGQLPDFFDKIQQGQAPDKFTQQHLKDIGFTSSSYRATVPLLKTLGFLSADGTPTSVYHSYRNKADGPRVLGQALREAYSDLFFIKDPPTEKDRPLIEGKFKSVHNQGDRVAELMAKTFFALVKIADLSQATKAATAKAHPPIEEEEASGVRSRVIQTESHHISPSLHYNIQIHLPATKDLEVYNAIFKSLKEHLLG